MDALELLRQGLRSSDPVLDPNWAVATQQVLERNLVHIKAWARGDIKPGAPSEESIVVALKEFWQRQRFSTAGHARYVCLGCTQEFGHQKLRLIEDEVRFPKVLEGLGDYVSQPRRLRRCYQGLLHSYLQYDPERAGKPAGKQNWYLLRTYLARHLTTIRVVGSEQPTWVESVRAQQHLFTDRACFEFASRALNGDTQPFEDMREALEINQQTWVTRRFVLSQIEAASQDSDREFPARIPYLLKLLGQYEDYADDGLAMVLERYCRGSSVEVHVALRDFAITRWRNPWLEANRKYWHDRVTTRVRETVAGWLKLKLMRDFFSLLADEGTNDRRRLEFWLSYIDRIDDMHFALGNDAMFNRTPDFVQLRSEMKGRLLRLHHGGPPKNNAFVMSVGGHYIVEFGEKGNACYVFDKRASLPFDLNRKEVSGDWSELKHKSHAWRLLHMDRSSQTWERQFALELSSVLGDAPAKPTAPVGTPRVLQSSVQSRSRPPRPEEVPAKFSEIEFARWKAQNRIGGRDMRAQGGALWVTLPRHGGGHAERLRKWGFQFSERRGEWWRDG